MTDRQRLLIALLSEGDEEHDRHRFSVLEVAAALEEMGDEYRHLDKDRRVRRRVTIKT